MTGDDHERSALSAVLVEHGLSEASAVEVASYSEILRRMTAAEGVEFAGMVDARTGHRLGDTIRGEKSLTDIQAHLDAMQPGRGYVQIHTHPGGWGPSVEDSQMMIGVAGLTAMVIASVDDTRFVLSRNPEGPATDQIRLPLEWSRAFRRTWAERIGRPTADMDETQEREAMIEVTRAMWHVLAPALGLRYARVQGKQ